MFGLPMLDVIIGLVFVYLLLALICATGLEILVGMHDTRTKNLREGIENLLGESNDCLWVERLKKFVVRQSAAASVQPYVSDFFNHPLIKSLREGDTNPSYIPPATFANVIFDIFAVADGRPKDLAAFTSGVDAVFKEKPNADLQKVLLLLAGQSSDSAELKKRLEEWFNDAMTRVSARYKCRTQLPLLGLAVVVCLTINADTFRIARDLYQDPAMRQAVLQQVQASLPKIEERLANPQDQSAKALMDQLNANVGQMQQAGLSLGWKGLDDFAANIGKGFFGILLTAMAASLGAPFWFDILKRFMSIRAVGKSLEELAVKK